MRAKVLAAAFDLVTLKGRQNVTIPGIAQEAGVAITSVYRRWGDVSSLLLDLAAERLALNWPLPDEGSIEKNLKRWGERIATSLAANEDQTFFRVLIAASDIAPEKRIAILATRLEEVQNMLDRSRVLEEWVPTVDDVIDYLLAPLYMRALLGLTTDNAFVDKLVDRLLNTNSTPPPMQLKPQQ